MQQYFKTHFGSPRNMQGIHNPDDFRAKAVDNMQRMQARFGFPEDTGIKPMQDVVAMPYVNQGRWVIDCECGGGVGASREWDLAICFDCGREYYPSWPADADDIEAQLMLRPDLKTRNCNCSPESAARAGYIDEATGLPLPETALSLLAENIIMGVVNARGN